MTIDAMGTQTEIADQITEQASQFTEVEHQFYLLRREWTTRCGIKVERLKAAWCSDHLLTVLTQ